MSKHLGLRENNEYMSKHSRVVGKNNEIMSKNLQFKGKHQEYEQKSDLWSILHSGQSK
jgi:hypothetical protein